MHTKKFYTKIVGKENRKRMKVWEIIEFRISVDNPYQLDTPL